MPQPYNVETAEVRADREESELMEEFRAELAAAESGWTRSRRCFPGRSCSRSGEKKAETAEDEAAAREAERSLREEHSFVTNDTFRKFREFLKWNNVKGRAYRQY